MRILYISISFSFPDSFLFLFFVGYSFSFFFFFSLFIFFCFFFLIFFLPFFFFFFFFFFLMLLFIIKDYSIPKLFKMYIIHSFTLLLIYLDALYIIIHSFIDIYNISILYELIYLIILQYMTCIFIRFVQNII